MIQYWFHAQNLKGECLKGTYEAEDERELYAALRKQGYYITTAMKKVNIFQHLGERKRFTSKELSILSEECSILLGAGITIVTALSFLSKQIPFRSMRVVLERVSRDITKGESLTVSLNKHTQKFPQFFLRLIEVGESCGRLEQVFKELNQYYVKENERYRKIKAAVTYPALVLFLSIGMIFYMITNVLPVFVSMLESFGGNLPMSTRVLLSCIQLIKQLKWYIILLCTGVALLHKWRSKDVKYQLLWDKVKVMIPFIGEIYVKSILSKFARSMYIMLHSGGNLIHSLETVVSTVNNLGLKFKLAKVTEKIISGSSISQSFKEANLFEPLIISMISVGEETGAIDDYMEKVALLYERDVETAIQRYVVLLEPSLVILCALIIGFMMTSILFPILNMMDVI